MQNDDEIDQLYRHIVFRKTWEIDHSVHYKIGECDAMVRAICQTPLQPAYHTKLLEVSLIKGAQATTAIEGNSLTEAEVEKVARGNSLGPSREYQEREVKNILAGMNNLLQEVAIDGSVPLISEELIKRFHGLVGHELGEHFDAIPGRFRTDERVVGPYKCPRAEDIQALIGRLCKWLQTEFGFTTGRQTFTDAVIQAIVTHVYLEWIHPFGDGNGRTGRLIEFYILLRAGNPDIASHILSNHYNKTRSEYYRHLDRAGKERDLTAFIRYAVQGYRDGLADVLHTIRENNLEMAWRYLIHARFAEHPYRKKSVFKRRRRLALSLPPNRALSLAELPLLTPEIARDYGSLSARTVLRDIEDLQRLDLVIEESGKYRANLGLLGSQIPARRRPESATAA